ncbi:unnamed protein product [Symbiodinium sp. CCMP2592]|nr:unnamed protein product [Symbiodinium sp. CCMP2592]
MLPHRVLRSRWAPWWPALSVSILALLILLCHVTALLSGKCDREQDGRVERAYITEISLTTETPPESYIWTLGVILTWILFLGPVAGLLHEVLWEYPLGYVLALPVLLAEALLVFGTLCLMGLATITNQGTFLEMENQIEDGHAIHQQLANAFFLCCYMHGALVVFLQGMRWKRHSLLERRSLVFKASTLIFLALSVTGVLPWLVMELIPALRTPMVRELNRRGLTQRLVVLGIMAFVGSYSMELLALRRRLTCTG